MEHQTLTPEERMVAERHQLRSRGILAGIVCNTIFGSSFLFSRIILSHTTPAVMLMLRFSIALLLMLFLIAFRVIKVDYRGKRVLPLLALGLTQPVAYFFCESYGIKYTNSSFSGVMIALIPIVAAILSSIFLREELKKSKLFWIFHHPANRNSRTPRINRWTLAYLRDLRYICPRSNTLNPELL